jgi:hypothetical protein
MVATTSKNQDLLDECSLHLAGRDSAELLLSTAIGAMVTEERLQSIERGLSEYIVWHNEQHSDSITCEHCEIIKENLIMYKVINHWLAHFLERKPNTVHNLGAAVELMSDR